MPLRLNGSTSGYSQLDAPAIAGDQTFTLPGTGGTIDRLNRAGNILQVVSFQTSTLDTGTQTIPLDDTIPQNTEGNQYMSLAITPTSSSSKLLIQSNAFLSHSATGAWIMGALFQDSNASASAVTAATIPAATAAVIISFNHYMTAGTTSSITFKFRAGAQSAGTTTFNGSGALRYLGGAISSSITITEIAA